MSGLVVISVILLASLAMAGARRRAAGGGAVGRLDALAVSSPAGHPSALERWIRPPLRVALRRLTKARRASEVRAALVGVVEGVAAGLRSGAGVRIALADAASLAPGDLAVELDAVSRLAQQGRPLNEALSGWQQQRRDAGVRMLVGAIAVITETGGRGGAALDGLANTLRDRLAIEGEVAAMSSQARISAVVIVVAPLVFALGMAATDPGTAHFYVATPLGWGVLAMGLALDAIAATWMRALARVRL